VDHITGVRAAAEIVAELLREAGSRP